MSTSAEYINLFGDSDREPGMKPEKRSAAPRTEPAFVVGAVRYEKMDVVWLDESGETQRLSITPRAVLDAWAALINATVEMNDHKMRRVRSAHAPPLSFTTEQAATAARAVSGNPTVPSQRTRKAPHVRGSATSEAAAASVTRKLAGKRLDVLYAFCRTVESFPGGGITDNEVTAQMVDKGWSPNTARPRRIELVRDGWLEDSGERRNGSIVWRPTAKAWTWWNQQQNGGG